MQDYFKDTEFVLNSLSFDYDGSRYRGRGVMTWNSEKGFHIEAPLELQHSTESQEFQFGKVGIIRKSDRSSIRLFPKTNYNWAIAPNVILVDRNDVMLQHRLSINCSRVIFSNFYPRTFSDSHFQGFALYQLNNISGLMDELLVEKKIKIQNKDIPQGGKITDRGIYYEGEHGQTIYGYSEDNQYLKIHWSLPKEHFSKNYSWRMGEAIQHSLSILLGQKIVLLKCELFSGRQQRIEIRKKERVKKLHIILSLFKEQFSLNKEHFIRLTDLIAKNTKEAQICLNIFQQLAAANRQENWQVKELLDTTILEAVLRNIDNQPFSNKKGGNKKWNLGKSLENFLEQYLSEEWVKFRDPIMKAHTYLRDRNAHPDWLFTKSGTLSEEELEKSVDSLIFLTQFYGYMILALIGIKNVKPLFPKPYSQWEAAYTIHSAILKQNPSEGFNQ